MTLLIACLLIYHFDMAGCWYAVAAGIWLLELKSWDTIIQSNVAHIRTTTACRYRERSL